MARITEEEYYHELAKILTEFASERDHEQEQTEVSGTDLDQAG